MQIWFIALLILNFSQLLLQNQPRKESMVESVQLLGQESASIGVVLAHNNTVMTFTGLIHLTLCLFGKSGTLHSFCHRLEPDGAAIQSGLIHEGDELMAIDGRNSAELSIDEVTCTLSRRDAAVMPRERTPS